MTLYEAMSLKQELTDSIVPKYRRWRRKAWTNKRCWIQIGDPLERVRNERWSLPEFTRGDLLADDWEEVHGK